MIPTPTFAEDSPMKKRSLLFVALPAILISTVMADQNGPVSNSRVTTFTTRSGETFKLGALHETEMPLWMQPSPAIAADASRRTSVDNSANLPPIKSQGGQGSCTAWATGYYYKSYQEWQEHGWDLSQETHQFSPAFVYNNINGGVDGGSFPTDAFKLLVDHGCATWVQMPYNDTQYSNLPAENVYRGALPYRSQQAYYIDLVNDLQSLKNHLQNGNVAVISIDIYDHFYDIANHGYVYSVSQMSGSDPGGHSVTICGYDNDLPTPDGNGAFKIANSWGPSWGDNGFFWMTYEAVQNAQLSVQKAYYASDRIDYQPLITSTFHVDHDIRGKVGFNFGLGEASDPRWDKKFFDWYIGSGTQIPFPMTNIVVDLTDGAPQLIQSGDNNIFIECQDRRFFWHLSTQHAWQGNSWWCADEEIPGYDSGWLMYYETDNVTLGVDQNELNFMLSYALEEPQQYGDYDGWDAATVLISTDGFATWDVLTGSPDYDFDNSWAWAWHGQGDSIPGWGGYNPQWQSAGFDLDQYASQNVALRIYFASDGGWSSADNPAYFGLVIDDIEITTAGNTLFFDNGDTGSRSLPGVIDYFAVEHSQWQMTVVSDETPVTIPEQYGNAVANLTITPPEPYSGPTWFVSNSGSDLTGDGSLNYPFASVQTGLNAADSSQSVVMTAGSYTENVVWPQVPDIKLNGSNAGATFLIGTTAATPVVDFNGINGDTTENETGEIRGLTIRQTALDAPAIEINDHGLVMSANVITSDGSLPLIHLEDGAVDLTNITMHGAGPGISAQAGTVDLTSSIVWCNPALTGDTASTIQADYSLIAGGWPGTANLSDDPLFCDPANHDFKLAANSPAIAAGENGGNMGALGIGCAALTATDNQDLWPTEVALYPNYPNPFNSTTQFRYFLPEAAIVTIAVYDLTGREINRLIDGPVPGGYHQIQWDGTNESQQSMPSGLYLGQLQCGNTIRQTKLLLIK